MVIDDTQFYRVLLFDTEEHYERLLGRLASATSASELNNRGLAHAELGDADAALADYTAAIDALERAGSRVAIPFVNRGDVLERLGRIDEALADYARAIASAPETPQFRRIRAHLLHELGRYEEAVADYDVAIHLDPEFAWTRDERAKAVARQKLDPP